MLSLLVLSCFLIGANAGVNRIAGGEVVSISQHPFATSLVTNVGVGAYTHSCGGSILTASAILSAASCFYTDEVADPANWWRVRVGSSYSNSGGLIYLIRQITPHPEFVPATRNNDIAVLRTSINIHLTPNVAERAFLSGSAYSISTFQPVWAIGWGAISSADSTPSTELRRVQIWAVDPQTCANRYAELGFSVTNTMVCAGWLDVGIRGQCQGDSGSALLDPEGFIVGVHSWTEGCAQGWYPGVNTQLAPYTQWVVATATA